MPRQPLVAEFRDLDGTFEVAGLGRVRTPFGDALEVEVEVFLAQRDARGREFIQASLASRWIGCGQLDLLTTGSRWSDGRRERHDLPEKCSTRSVRLSSPLVTRGEHVGSSLKGFPVLPISGAPCFLVSFNLDDGGTGIARVPKIEVARAVFGVSSTFLLEMMDGIRDGTIANDRGLFDRARSGMTSPGTVSIHASRQLSRREAIVIAALLTDEKLRSFHDAVFQSLVVSPEFRNSGPAYIDAPYPFPPDTLWTFQSRWFERSLSEDEKAVWVRQRRGKPLSPWTSVVTRIVGIDFPLSFESVEIHAPASSTTQGSEGLPPRNNVIRIGSTGRAWLSTGRAPRRGGQPLEIPSPDVANSHSDRVSVTHVLAPPTVKSKASTVKEEARDETEHGTSGRDGSASSDVRPARIIRGLKRPATPAEEAMAYRTDEAAVIATLAALDDALENLDDAADWQSELFSGPGYLGPTSYAEEMPLRFRRMLIAEIETERGFVVLADVGPVQGQARSLAMLKYLEGANITVAEVEQIRGFAASNKGHWRGRDELLVGFKTIPMNRMGAESSSVRPLAESIVGVVRHTLFRVPRARPIPS